ncbi:mucin-2-like [Ruditapes philippinarum]|uniref:mucin-2-like n=1 Tax=Ruditapes philippinarum TaxID=129788 RepID=UPI00295C0299|nr:mucin-2-like [Ruditapes philippinarum]
MREKWSVTGGELDILILFVFRKSIHQKLLELYIEETGKQSDEKKLQCNTHLLRKLVRREKLNCLILNLYPGNDGYSLMLRSKTGVETETCKLPYEVTELLDYIDDSELPPFLVDVLEKAQVNVFYNGCVIVEVRDFRRATNGTFDMQYVLLKPNTQVMEHLICNMFSLNQIHRYVKKYNQSAANRKRKFAACSAPSELKLHDFISKKKDKKTSSKFGKSAVDYWKQSPVILSAPESVDVERFAKIMEKPEKNSVKDNTLNLVEEHVLERDGMQDKKLLAKLTIYHRPGDDAHLGELYLDHDYIEEKSKGATCRFLLGNKDSVKKYLDQFREIFTEEGRRAVKITTQRPGQAPIVTCTQTTPTTIATATVNQTATKPVSTAAQAVELSQSATMSLGSLKRSMPIQLSLSIGPTLGTAQAAQQIQQAGTSSQAANQIQLNMQSSSINQSPLATQRLQQASQSQSASQRLKQLGIHTSIASRNNTPTASPVTSQPPIAQLFGSPPSASAGGVQMLPQQQAVSTRTPTHTPTPTPPPSIVSPPPQNTGLVRKSSLTAESSTIHHMAQTTHQANVSSIVQGEGNTSVSTSISHQPQGVANINIANITGIPPNINIQNLTGLPGMNIANLQGLQNMQVSLSLPGGSIAVPISMINTNSALLQNQQGILGVSSGGSSSSNTPSGVTTVMSVNPSQSTVVSMVTQSSALSHAVATTSHIVTGVISQSSNVIPGTSMLSVPINLAGTQLVPAGLKAGNQTIRSSSSIPLQLQFGQQGIQFVNLQQQPRQQMKAGTSLQQNQTLTQVGVKPSTSIQGPLTTAILPTHGPGQHVLSQIPVGKSGGPAGGITTTLTHQQLVQLQPQFQAQLQAFKNTSQGPQQQLQFHQILKQPVVPTQPNISFGGKPKNKKRTTPTPPK